LKLKVNGAFKTLGYMNASGTYNYPTPASNLYANGWNMIAWNLRSG